MNVRVCVRKIANEREKARVCAPPEFCFFVPDISILLLDGERKNFFRDIFFNIDFEECCFFCFVLTYG